MINKLYVQMGNLLLHEVHISDNLISTSYTIAYIFQVSRWSETCKHKMVRNYVLCFIG